MASLTCDICGGKLIVGTGGIATCDSCGMEHTKDRVQEKAIEIKGTIRIDNSHMIGNYLIIAENAYEVKNNSEAEIYCNKIIEIDPSHHKAWFLKGKVAGRSSKLINIRLEESANCFAKAIELAPEDIKVDLIKEAADEMGHFLLNLISSRVEIFIKCPAEETTTNLLKDIDIALDTITSFSSKIGIAITGFLEPIASFINFAVMTAWEKVIIIEYEGNDNRPNEGDFVQYINRINCCTILLEKAIALSDEDDVEDIERYKNLIFLNNKAIKGCSWCQEYCGEFLGYKWNKEYTLSNSAVEKRKNSISEYNKKIDEIKNKKTNLKKDELELRYKEYWDAHYDEKIKLENEKKHISEQIALLEKEKLELPILKEKENLKEQIAKLNNDKKNLGFFALEEKKEMQVKIDEAIRHLILYLVR